MGCDYAAGEGLSLQRGPFCFLCMSDLHGQYRQSLNGRLVIRNVTELCTNNVECPVGLLRSDH